MNALFFMRQTETFRYGKRFAVTFQCTQIDEYSRKPIGVSRRAEQARTRRKAIVCILREAYTGIPYTGIAILAPCDIKNWDYVKGCSLAMKRAIAAYTSCDGCRRGMWQTFRLEMLKRYDPEKYADIQNKLQLIMADRIKKIKLQKAKDRLGRMLQTSKVVDFNNGKVKHDIMAVKAMSGE